MDIIHCTSLHAWELKHYFINHLWEIADVTFLYQYNLISTFFLRPIVVRWGDDCWLRFKYLPAPLLLETNWNLKLETHSFICFATSHFRLKFDLHCLSVRNDVYNEYKITSSTLHYNVYFFWLDSATWLMHQYSARQYTVEETEPFKTKVSTYVFNRIRGSTQRYIDLFLHRPSRYQH